MRVGAGNKNSAAWFSFAAVQPDLLTHIPSTPLFHFFHHSTIPLHLHFFYSSTSRPSIFPPFFTNTQILYSASIFPPLLYFTAPSFFQQLHSLSPLHNSTTSTPYPLHYTDSLLDFFHPSTTSLHLHFYLSTSSSSTTPLHFHFFQHFFHYSAPPPLLTLVYNSPRLPFLSLLHSISSFSTTLLPHHSSFHFSTLLHLHSRTSPTTALLYSTTFFSLLYSLPPRHSTILTPPTPQRQLHLCSTVISSTPIH